MEFSDDNGRGYAVARSHAADLLVLHYVPDMIIGRTARIDLTTSVIDRGGLVVYQDNAVDSESDMKFMQAGVLADYPGLFWFGTCCLSV